MIKNISVVKNNSNNINKANFTNPIFQGVAKTQVVESSLKFVWDTTLFA